MPLGDRGKIVDELKFLVEKQWDEWQRFPRAIALPREYVGDNAKSKEEFILRVTAQLNVHIAGSSPTLTLAQDAFKKSATKVRGLMYLGEPLPSRKKKTERSNVFNIADYWNVVALELPELFVIYSVGCHACATEAATERAFSSEGIAHDALRNLLAPSVVNSILKIRWNFEKVKQLQIRPGRASAEAIDYEDVVSDEE